MGQIAGPPPSGPDAARGTERVWHPFKGEDDPPVVTQEIVAALRAPWPGCKDGPTPAELKSRAADFKAAVRSAGRGCLTDGRWDHVARHPLLWEFRHEFARPVQDDSPGLLLRGYFYEPPEVLGMTVLARVHIKDVTGTADEIRACQDEHIDVAYSRVTFGRDTRWGLDVTEPICA